MDVIYLNDKDFKLNTDHFSPFVKKLKKQMKTMEGALNVVFVNDAYIQSLNKIYRGKDKSTDVLSFNYQGEETDSQLMGEVYISVPTAERQAKDHKHSLHDEITKLLIHGILHVHGHDHEEDEEYKQMYAVEKAVLGDIAGELILD